MLTSRNWALIFNKHFWPAFLPRLQSWGLICWTISLMCWAAVKIDPSFFAKILESRDLEAVVKA